MLIFIITLIWTAGMDDTDDEEAAKHMTWADFMGEDDDDNTAGKKSKKSSKHSDEEDEDEDEDDDDEEDNLLLGGRAGGSSNYDGKSLESDHESDPNESSDPEQDEDEEGNNDEVDFESLSSHEKRQLVLRKQIDELEDKLLKPRSWDLIGEVSATKRPENSLLEKNLDVNYLGVGSMTEADEEEMDGASSLSLSLCVCVCVCVCGCVCVFLVLIYDA